MRGTGSRAPDGYAMRKLHDAFSSLPEQALLPCDAYECVVRGTVEPVPLSDLGGRTTAVAIVPYPPGDPAPDAGRAHGRGGRPVARLPRYPAEFDRRFPGDALVLRLAVPDPGGDGELDAAALRACSRARRDAAWREAATVRRTGFRQLPRRTRGR
jgi:hypothetical protein